MIEQRSLASPIVTLILLVAAGLVFWTIVRSVVHVLAAVVLVMAVAGLAATMVWRRLLPRRATEALAAVARTRERERPRLRRLSCRGSVWHLAWRVPTGVTVSGLVRQREALEQALDASIELWYDRGLVHMRAGTARLPAKLDFLDFYRRPGPGELPLGIGMGRAGPVWEDLTALPHLLVGGTTGGGKTAFLRQAITSLVLRLPAQRLRLALLDLKGMEFGIFEGLPHLLRPVARDPDVSTELLAEVGAELDWRQAAFARAGVQTLQRWNEAKPAEALPYVLVVVDECAELSAAEVSDRNERARRQQALASISRLCRLGRASGIHVILSTQRPDADTVPGQIKANVPATVAFRVRGETNSRILLGEGNEAAAVLPPHPGRGVWQWDTETQFQAPWLSAAAAEALLDAARARDGAAGTQRVTPCPQCPGGELA